MFQTYLILAGTKKERQNQANQFIKKKLDLKVFPRKGHPDLINLEGETSLGINQIRLLQKQLALKPYSAPFKIALITEAEKLTIPAQNALLKILEEPPARTLIILLAPQKEALLPTIISRCQLIHLNQKPQLEIDQDFLRLSSKLLILILRSSIGERINFAQEFSQRPKAVKLVNYFLFLWREKLLIKTGVKKEETGERTKGLSLSQIKLAIKNTQKARVRLTAQTNPRLTMENLFLSYPNLSISK